SSNYIVGGKFNAGDVLLRLDPSDYNVALERAKALEISRQALYELEKARSVQAKKEWQMTGRPESEAPLLALRKPYLAEAEANLLQAQAEVRQAEIKLQRTTIRAPYAGMVTEKSVDVGQYVTVGSRLGETFAIDFVEVRLPLTERDLANIDPASLQSDMGGENVRLSGSVNGVETNWKAQLVRSEGVINELNRSQYLVARVADPYGLIGGSDDAVSPLLVGTFVTAQFNGKTLNGVVRVPRGTLLQGSRVAVVNEDQTLSFRKVKVLFSDENYYFVNEGLESGVELIISAVGTAVDGMPLQVRNDLYLGSAD
ncbi:efflux RND transporter periplasmic adaptor subunit, partial [Porticoccaceae bacterium]|nr:efflux RND transporter periplasmic adaptor subunit [Porticoccaceae bacterium]